MQSMSVFLDIINVDDFQKKKKKKKKKKNAAASRTHGVWHVLCIFFGFSLAKV